MSEPVFDLVNMFFEELEYENTDRSFWSCRPNLEYPANPHAQTYSSSIASECWFPEAICVIFFPFNPCTIPIFHELELK